jgi:hypothetical protein
VDYDQIDRALAQGQLPSGGRPNELKMTEGYVAVIQTIMICNLGNTVASDLTPNLPPCIVFNFELYLRQQYLQHVARLHLMHANNPNPQPLEVFTDEEDPPKSITCYIMLCMFQGDLVQQGIAAKVTGYTGEKGCLRCFMLEANTLQDGTDLRTQRWLG